MPSGRPSLADPRILLATWFGLVENLVVQAWIDFEGLVA